VQIFAHDCSRQVVLQKSCWFDELSSQGEHLRMLSNNRSFMVDHMVEELKNIHDYQPANSFNAQNILLGGVAGKFTVRANVWLPRRMLHAKTPMGADRSSRSSRRAITTTSAAATRPRSGSITAGATEIPENGSTCHSSSAPHCPSTKSCATGSRRRTCPVAAARRLLDLDQSPAADDTRLRAISVRLRPERCHQDVHGRRPRSRGSSWSGARRSCCR